MSDGLLLWLWLWLWLFLLLLVVILEEGSYEEDSPVMLRLEHTRFLIVCSEREGGGGEIEELQHIMHV